MKEVVIIYPHQLFHNNPLLKPEVIVFLVEEPLLFTQYTFHKQKLILHRASMRSYRDWLLQKGHSVVYVECSDIKETGDIAEILAEKKITKVSFCDVADDWLSSRLQRALSLKSIEYTVIDTPMFLTGRKELKDFFSPLFEKKKKFFMKTFYEWQRKRLSILIEPDGSPVGGKWSYDEDNRKKIPKDLVLENPPEPNINSYVIEAKRYIEKNFSKNYGNTDEFFYPTTFEEAKDWLRDFLELKLDMFGPYEDAITTRSNFLFHSILSPLLNIGLLEPEYVIKETLKYAKNNPVRIASLEGFIRQIIGWREYMRAVYVYYGRRSRASNYFHSNRNIPQSFWNASTGIDPVDDACKGLLSYAYTHHIPRLMILGNFMNLCQFHPDQVYRWFMEMSIDSYDWVMVPNVYSMALYADGGLITTKPYISGSAYIIGMSNYKKGEWSEIWDALFWNFVGNHYEALSREGRLGYIGLMYKKMNKEKKEAHIKRAREFLGSK